MFCNIFHAMAVYIAVYASLLAFAIYGLTIFEPVFQLLFIKGHLK